MGRLWVGRRIGHDPDDVLYDMLSNHDIDTARAFWVTADLPLPADTEVDAASVEPADANDNARGES